MVIRFRRRFQILLSSAMDVLIVCGILFGMGARSHFPNVEPPDGSRYHRARPGPLRQTVASPGHCQCVPSHPGQAINSQDSANWCTGCASFATRTPFRMLCPMQHTSTAFRFDSSPSLCSNCIASCNLTAICTATCSPRTSTSAPPSRVKLRNHTSRHRKPVSSREGNSSVNRSPLHFMHM